MESCDVLVIGGGPAGLSLAGAVGKGVIVVHQDAEIGTPVRTSGGSWKRHIDALGIPSRLYQTIDRLRFASTNETFIFEFDREKAVVLDVTGTYQHLAEIARQQGADIRCGNQFISIDRQAPDSIISTISDGQTRYLVRSKLVIDASGFWRAAMPVVDGMGAFDRLGIGAECEVEDLSDDKHVATLLVGSRFTDPGYGWIFPTPAGTVRIGVGHCKPGNPHSPKQSLKRLMASELLERYGVKTGQHIANQGGIIPNVGALQVFGKGRIIGIGDVVGHALPLVGEGIRYCIEIGRYVGALVNDHLQNKRTPESIIAQYTDWWNTRWRRPFAWSQWLNERITQYNDDSWDRGLRRLGKIAPDDIARLLQADLTPGVVMRIALANRDLPMKIARAYFKR